MVRLHLRYISIRDGSSSCRIDRSLYDITLNFRLDEPMASSA